jgi:hypothetical protein
MQKQFTTLCAAVALIGMLLGAGSRVNHPSTVPVWNTGSQLADGVPMPPPKPSTPSFNTNITIADGVPMPPPKPSTPSFIV